MMYNIHDDITYVKKSICSFLFVGPTFNTSSPNLSQTWNLVDALGVAEVEPFVKVTFHTGEADEVSWKHRTQRTPPMKSENIRKVSKSSDFACVYASGTGQSDIYVVMFLLKSNTPVSGCGLGYAQSEHQWTFLVALGAIETPTISCTYCVQNYQVYTWYRCVIHIDTEPPNPQKLHEIHPLWSTFVGWPDMWNSVLCLKKNRQQEKSTKDSTRQLFYMSTVMPFFLIFSTIGYVPLGVLSWTRRVWWGELKCCQICYRSWDCCNFVHIFSVFFSLMMMLGGWYLLHEKLLTERSLVTFWLNKQLQNVIGLVTWLTSFQSLVWFRYRDVTTKDQSTS